MVCQLYWHYVWQLTHRPMPPIGGPSRTRRQQSTVARLRLSDDTREFVIPIEEIDLVEGSTGRLRIHHGPRTYLTMGKLSELAARLGPLFIRVSRSTLVNVDRVERCTPLTEGAVALHLPGNRCIKVTGRYRMTVQLDRLLESGGTSAADRATPSA